MLVHTFRQARHVSEMSIKRIAHEGDISLRLLLPFTTALMLSFLLGVLAVLANQYYASVIIYILGYMILPMVIITMIFLPKVI